MEESVVMEKFNSLNNKNVLSLDGLFSFNFKKLTVVFNVL